MNKLPLAHYLKKIHSDDHKKLIKNRFRIILDKLHIDYHHEDNIPELNKCLEYLGLATVRGDMITQTNAMIQDAYGRYSMLRPWSKELFELRENNNKLIELLNKMIRAHLFQQIKEEDNVKV